MDKSRIIVLAGAAMCLNSLLAATPQVFWKADAEGGSGGWGDATRWRDGVVPGAGDQVRIPHCSATVTDADKAVFESVLEIVLPGADARLTISNDTDITFTRILYGEGVVEKYGSGAFNCTRHDATQLQNTGGWNVHSGSLALAIGGSSNSSVAGPVNIDADALLKVSAAGTANRCLEFKKGLWGDGTVNTITNGVNTITLRFSSPMTNDPPRFGGTFTGHARTLEVYGRQYFDNPDYIYTGNLYNNGEVGGVRCPVPVMRDAGTFVFYGTTGDTADSRMWINNSCTSFTVDSLYGGLTFSSEIQYNIGSAACKNHQGVMEWRAEAGSNEFKGTILVGGTLKELNPSYTNIYWKKTGAGIWKFSKDSSLMMGTVATEGGVLEFTKMAERGVSTPLGTALDPQREHNGEIDGTQGVGYAYLVGSGSTVVDAATPTMKYVGATDISITTRPIAVKGAGRLSSSGAAVGWSGITASAPGAHTIVLGGTAGGSAATCITNGPGTVGVAKDGSGSWTISGENDFSGPVEVKEGSLVFDRRSQYEFYKFTIMQNWRDECTDGDGGNAWISCFALIDGDGNNLAMDITANNAADGAPTSLAANEAAFAYTGMKYLQNASLGIPRALSNAFDTAESVYAGNHDGKPVVDNPNTWIPIVMRLPVDHAPVVKYDFRHWVYRGYAQTLWCREPRSWKLEGSIDGITWDTLHTVISNSTPVTGGSYHWASTDTTDYGGFPVAATAAITPMASIVSLKVAPGASFSVLGPALTVNGLDCAAGGSGSISNVTLAASGTLNVSGDGAGNVLSTSFPVDLGNAAGAANVKAWNLTVDGIARPTWRVGGYADGSIEILPPGTILIFR